MTTVSSHRKRQLDCEDDGSAAEVERSGNGHKKPRILPIRTAHLSTTHNESSSISIIHTSPAWTVDLSDPPILTPADSDEDASSPSHPANATPSSLQPHDRPLAYLHSPDDHAGYPFDLDMLDSPPVYSPQATSSLLSPLNGPSLANDRLPTPMFGTFPESVLSNPQHQYQNRSAALINGNTGSSTDTSDLAYQHHLHRRRLPSPISEDEDALTPMSITEAGDVMGRLSVNGEHDRYQRDSGSMDVEGAFDPTYDGDPGRGRSRHRPNGDKQGKPALAMGYRADCEKCRARVPGHYSHVMRG
ncbi:MAG: hypothetical protein M1837_003122 [Sclerophora amabilis]|nr:MAG: hypothetical protein M1837_003122 [Sclerophora amabilis]